MDVNQSELTLSRIKDILLTVSSNGLFKAIVGIIFISLNWLFGHSAELILVIYCLLTIDTVTGVIKAAKKSQVSSKGFFKFCTKVLVYFIMLATAALVDKIIPLPYSLSIMCAFLSITESVSILENVSELGFPVPKRLVKLLKSSRD